MNIKDWNALNPVVIKKMRAKLFTRALYVLSFRSSVYLTKSFYSLSAKVRPDEEYVSQFNDTLRDRALAELEGRTGDTDSEPDEDEDDGSDVDEPEPEEM